MPLDKFNLSRNDFHISSASAFRDLLKENYFVDVTLACEDGQQVKPHKVILSYSSLFFKNILIKNLHPKPLILLAGIKFEDLNALITFIYLGEVSLAENDLGSFLHASEVLKIEGLSNYCRMFQSVIKQSKREGHEEVNEPGT